MTEQAENEIDGDRRWYSTVQDAYNGIQETKQLTR